MSDIIGTSGNDTLTENAFDGRSPNTNNTFIGGDGDDTIIAGPDDQVIYTTTTTTGNPNNPTIKTQTHDVQDNDVIVGGLGDDTMTGGYGNDVFAFNFSVTVEKELKTVLFRDGDAPSQHADYKAWYNYSTQLQAWRDEMTALHQGPDENQVNTFSVDITVNGGTAKKPAYSPVHFNGDNSYSWYETTTKITGDGHDIIIDWGDGHDTLALNGLSNDTSLANYWGKVLTSEDTVDGQTVISFEGGSITLVGVDTSIADLVAGGDVTFA